MDWYMRLGALLFTVILIAPFILKTLRLKDEEDESKQE
jgi:hypothetical protein